MRLVVLSPHRDDAAFSCGMLLAQIVRARGSVHVVNVCTQSNYAPYFVPAGSSRQQQVSTMRRLEDEAFLRLLARDTAPSLLTGSKSSVSMTDLDWLDAPLRLGIATEAVLSTPDVTPQDVERLARQLQAFRTADAVLAPAGLGNHVDHRLVRNAARAALPPERLGFYEDLPYAAGLSAAERETATAALLCGSPVTRCLFPAHRPGLKHRQVLCYPSQVGPELADAMEADAAQFGYAERLHLPDGLSRRLAQAVAVAS